VSAASERPARRSPLATPDRPPSNGGPRIRAGGFRQISSLIVACYLFNRQGTSGDAIGKAHVDHIRNLSLRQYRLRPGYARTPVADERSIGVQQRQRELERARFA
jgi:hypothetical protein